MRKNIMWSTALAMLLLLSACGTSSQPAASPVAEQMPEPEEENWSPYDSEADTSEFILSNGLHPGMSYTEVVETMGEPSYVNTKLEYSDGYARYELEYGDDVLTMSSGMSEPQDLGIENAVLSAIQLRCADMATARDIRVGDSMDSVFMAYGLDGDGGVSENVLRLYGKEGCGYRNYDAAVDFCVPSEAGGYVIIFLFTGEELSGIMLRSNEAYEWPEAVYPPAYHEEEKEWNPYTSECDMTDFILSNGLYLGMSFADVVDIMGEPDKVEEQREDEIMLMCYTLFYDSGEILHMLTSSENREYKIGESRLAGVQLRSDVVTTSRGVSVGDSIDSVCAAYGLERESEDSELRICGNWQRLYGSPDDSWSVHYGETDPYGDIICFYDRDLPETCSGPELQVLFFMFTGDELTGVLLRSDVATDWKPCLYPPLDAVE